MVFDNFFKEKKRLDEIQCTSDDPIIPNYISIREAFYFVWSLPVSVLITGAENKEFLEEKIDLVRKFSGLSEEDRYQQLLKVSQKAGGKVEYYKEV